MSVRIAWRMPNGHEGHGVFHEDSQSGMLQSHVDYMNSRYGAGTHWIETGTFVEHSRPGPQPNEGN